MTPSDQSLNESMSEYSNSSEDPSLLRATDLEANRAEADDKSAVAHEETKMVNRSKLLVYLILVILAATVGTATYILSSGDEEDNFEVKVRFELLSCSVILGETLLPNLANISIVFLPALTVLQLFARDHRPRRP